MDIVQLEKIVNDGLVKYKAFKDADIALSEIKCLIQAKSDLSKEVEKLNKETADLKDVKSAAIANIAKAKADADNILDLAGSDAFKIVEKANEAAKQTIQAADAQAKGIVLAVADKEKQLAIVNAAIKLAQDEHAKINAALENARSQLKALLG